MLPTSVNIKSSGHQKHSTLINLGACYKYDKEHSNTIIATLNFNGLISSCPESMQSTLELHVLNPSSNLQVYDEWEHMPLLDCNF